MMKAYPDFQLVQGGLAQTDIEVRMDEERETFWLSLNQISKLFERDKSLVFRHLKNIFRDKELDKVSVVAFFATTAADGKELYHIGASLKDLGKKCLPSGQAGFAFSGMDSFVNEVLLKLNKGGKDE